MSGVGFALVGGPHDAIAAQVQAGAAAANMSYGGIVSHLSCSFAAAPAVLTAARASRGDVTCDRATLWVSVSNSMVVTRADMPVRQVALMLAEAADRAAPPDAWLRAAQKALSDGSFGQVSVPTAYTETLAVLLEDCAGLAGAFGEPRPILNVLVAALSRSPELLDVAEQVCLV
jgi:hypothetical protein